MFEGWYKINADDRVLLLLLSMLCISFTALIFAGAYRVFMYGAC